MEHKFLETTQPCLVSSSKRERLFVHLTPKSTHRRLVSQHPFRPRQESVSSWTTIYYAPFPMGIFFLFFFFHASRHVERHVDTENLLFSTGPFCFTQKSGWSFVFTVQPSILTWKKPDQTENRILLLFCQGQPVIGTLPASETENMSSPFIASFWDTYTVNIPCYAVLIYEWLYNGTWYLFFFSFIEIAW